MARAIRAERSTIIGTPEQIKQFLHALLGDRSAAVDLSGSNFVILAKPLTEKQLRQALKVTPER